MARLGIKEAFQRYDAPLRNVMWSVSAWNPSGELVVSLWAHHYRKGPDGTAEFSGSTQRWSGLGCTEFRENVEKAFAKRTKVRLVIAQTSVVAHVEDGKDATKIKKDFDVKTDWIGEILSFDGVQYVFRFSKT